MAVFAFGMDSMGASWPGGEVGERAAAGSLLICGSWGRGGKLCIGIGCTIDGAYDGGGGGDSMGGATMGGSDMATGGCITAMGGRMGARGGCMGARGSEAVGGGLGGGGGRAAGVAGCGGGGSGSDFCMESAGS